ncbi:hypothetical protein OG568_61270 (plasmid) [Streptomyces sp. NBC_01450]|uniref:hypothetical protein n=1 Tax=Streptomyces sp. NBC_01450 TaxID=2903871 RepID=UPI002E34AB91|nr:hypothetical protein [Streptomyces sp. NBC_01450]
MQLYMEDRGWKLIEGKIGSRTKHFDLVFEKNGRVLVTQVKTSSEEYGWIRYQPANPRKSAEGLVQAASTRSGQAIMVLVQLHEAPTTVLAERDGLRVLETVMPEAALITWAEPLKFADMVEEARDEYAKGFYQGGKKKGQPLPRTGLGYPVCVDQFQDLESFLASPEVDSGPEPSEEFEGSAEGPRS